MAHGHLAIVAGACAGVLALLATPTSAAAATWVGARTSPALGEIVVVDQTGEPGWPYGFEDLAGDGQTFQPAEQAVDIRTAYAATDATRLWLRAYVSSAAAPTATDVIYAFIDSDANVATGGTAAAPAIHAKLVLDPTPGGYEYVLGVGGNGVVIGLWAWNAATSTYDPVTVNPSFTAGEAGAEQQHE